MKTKFLKVTDSSTELYYLIIQFQKSDNHFLEKCGQSDNLKIIINLSDTPATCLAGYDLNERCGNTIDNLSKLMESNGTIKGLKEIIHNTLDISHLPDVLDVEKARWAYIHTNLNQETHEELNDIIENICSDNSYMYRLNKYIFKQQISNTYVILIIDKLTDQIIFEESFFSNEQNDIFIKYIWIPLEEISNSEFIQQYISQNGVEAIEV